MFKPRTLSMLIAATALAGCQAVNTTSGGAVGVDRKQYMFSMLSTDQVNLMYAQSYQETLSAAASKGVLEKNTAIAKRVNGIAERLIAKVGVFRPKMTDVAQLGPGEVGFFTGSIKEVADTRVGERDPLVGEAVIGRPDHQAG